MKSINFKIIISFLGLTSVMNGVFMMLSAPFSWYYDEDAFSGIISAGLITIFLGAAMWYLTRHAPKKLQKKEGYMIVTFGWVMLTLTGTLPYLFTGAIPNFVDAIFEAISGYSTTGASILTDIESLPKGILFWRSSTHWIGGMGIIVLTIAILPLLGIGGMQLFMAEAPGPSADKMHPRITETAKRLWLIYFMFTIAEFLLLKIAGMGWYDAINHAMATMSTGGFSTKNASIAFWNGAPVIQYIIIVFMFIAGTNFILSYFALNAQFKKVIRNEEFMYYFLGVIGFITMITLVIVFYQDPNLHTSVNHPMPWGRVESSFRHASFQVLAIITTTGFVTADYTMWHGIATMLIFSLFFLGGSAGSTAGGVKIVRHIIMVKNAILEFKKILHPNAIIPVRYDKSRVPGRVVYNILSFFVLYMGIFIGSTVVLSMMGLDFNTAIGAAASTLGNVGPAFGKLGPVDNYAWLPDSAKLFSSFLMLIGRLELFTVLVLFTPFFWRKN
jgi:trk system potassium uptake protein TrkH